MKAIDFLNSDNQQTAKEFLDIENDAKNFLGIDKSLFDLGDISPLPESDVSLSAPKAALALAGGMQAFPVSGLAGLGLGMIEPPEDTSLDIPGEPSVGGRLNFDLARAGRAVEDIAGFPQQILQGDVEAQRTVEGALTPLKYVENAARFYGDWVYNNWPDRDEAEAMGALTKSIVEGAVYVGLPGLKAKLIKNLAVKDFPKVRETLKRIGLEKKPEDIVNKPTPETEFLQSEFKKRFVFEEEKPTEYKPINEEELPFSAKSAKESAKIFEQELDKKKSAYVSAQVFEKELSKKSPLYGVKEGEYGEKLAHLRKTDEDLRLKNTKEIDRDIARFKARNPEGAEKLLSMAPGIIAGVQEDDDGNITFDPGRAILGAVLGAAVYSTVSKIGITSRIKKGEGKGKFLRGTEKLKGKNPIEIVSKVLKDDIIDPKWDLSASVKDAKIYAENIKWLKPTIENKRYPLRYKYDPKGDRFVGNIKMQETNQSFPHARNTWEKGGCGRSDFINANKLYGESEFGAADQSCYGGACYANVPRYGRDASKSSAKVSTNLEPTMGEGIKKFRKPQDIRLGVDTDGSAWLADPKVMDAILDANPRTVTVYSSAYHEPPSPHPLSKKAIINVTVSGWHPLPETLARLRWAKIARDNGWNVILREVTASPEKFTKAEAARYNRTHDAIHATDFFVMEQPLHRGAAYGEPISKTPACCQAKNNIHTCDGCEVAEGLGKGFQMHWGIGETRKEKVLPGVKDYKGLKEPSGATTLYSGIPIHKAGKAYTKLIGEPVWDKLVMKKIPKLLEKVPGGKTVNRALMYEYRGGLKDTAKYMKSFEDMKRSQAIGREYGIDLGKRLSSVPESSQLKIGEVIRGEKVDLTPAESKLADEAMWSMLELGKQAVDAGLLSEETFFKNAGQYMPRLYTSKEYQSLLTKFNLKKATRLDLSRFKRRKDIPKEVRQEMGEILTPGYPIAKGIATLTHDIEVARFFNGIAENPDWAMPKGAEGTIPEGWKQLPSNDKLGNLSKAHVHPEIFNDLQETIRVMTTPEKVWRKALGTWKFGKVIISPKTHVRNLMSNSVLAHLGGLPMYEQPYYLAKAAHQMKTNGKYWEMMRKEGGGQHTFTAGELKALFDQVEGQMKDLKAGSLPEKFGIIGNAWQKSKNAMRKAANLYEAEEQWFKMAKFIHNIERKKMTPKVAWADAEKWLFNYSKVTRFQEKYRSKWYGAPFATFTFKALPRIAEAMVKTPWRFALPTAIIYGLEKAAQRKIGDTPEEIKAKKALRPEWQKGKMLGVPNFARVPIVDEYGREYFLNLTYILPWGDLGEAGKFGPIPGGLRPFSQPFINEPVQQIMNYDPFWKKEIVPESELAGKSKIGKIATEAKERGKHLAQTILPTPVFDVAKIIDAIQRKPDYRGRLRPPGVVAADVIAGIKMYPVDYTEQVVKDIGKINPQTGYLAKQILGQIRTLAIKKQAVQKKGGNTETYDDAIKKKIEQLKGLGRETKEKGKLFKKSGVH